jgi:predicted nucleotidyltransferase
MSRIPKDPKEMFSSIVDDYKGVFGDDLISVVVYGSAATGEYIPGTSDINVMVILSEKGIDALDQALDLVAHWRKRKVATPLFLTEEYIRTSLDVFPVEYLNFKKNHQVVYGKDILSGLRFVPEFVRLQCERELKGKLILLQEAFLETGGKAKRLQRLVGESLGAFVAIFNGLMYLKEKPLSRGKRAVVETTCDTFDMDKALFERLLDVKEQKVKPSGEEMTRLFRAYLKQIRKLWKSVDELAGSDAS